MGLVDVRYSGLADIREIKKSVLKSRGIQVDKDLVWSRRNGFRIRLDATDALVELLKEQANFKVSEVTDDNATGEEVVRSSVQGGEDGADVVVTDTPESGRQTTRRS